MSAEFIPNPQGMQQLKVALGEKLEQVGNRAVDTIKARVAVDTGRLQASTRRSDAEIEQNQITVHLFSGGTEQPGVYREVGIVREVDYAQVQEIRSGNVRSTIPDVMAELKREFS